MTKIIYIVMPVLTVLFLLAGCSREAVFEYDPARVDIVLRTPYEVKQGDAKNSGRVIIRNAGRIIDERSITIDQIAPDAYRVVDLLEAPFNVSLDITFSLTFGLLRFVGTVNNQTFIQGQSTSVSVGLETDTTPTEMVFVQGGTYEMGDQFAEGTADELPVHSITLSDFQIGKYEVTQAEWRMIMPGATYDFGSGDNYPVYYVSWYEVLVYCNRRSISEGLTPVYSIDGSTDPDAWGAIPATANVLWDAAVCNLTANGYRLPTEAEWEYAARGGVNWTDNYRFSGGNVSLDVAWYFDNSEDGTKPVGTKAANQLGIYDMSGNAYEFCWDYYDAAYYQFCVDNTITNDPMGPAAGTTRIARGGVWSFFEVDCRVSSRANADPSVKDSGIGFRLARTP